MANILIIDDEPDFAEYTAEVLLDLDHIVSIATDAASFAREYSRDIDLIFSDLFMPDIDGIEIIRFLSQNVSRASLVLMSGKDNSILNSARELAKQRGVHVLGTLQKPFLFADVENVLDGFKPADAPISKPMPAFDPLKHIEAALAEEQLFTVYQPQVDLNTLEPTGYETLIRWNHPEFGLISPLNFIPIIEHSPYIDKVTTFVVDAALRDLTAVSTEWPDIKVSINFSSKTMRDVELVDRIAETAANKGIERNRITLEMTETALSDNIADYMDILNRLRMQGFNISIDDFGTGYSSLLQLIRMPFNELKIDQSFVFDMRTSKECESIVLVSSILAKQLGMISVAEGIEDISTLSALREAGCNIGQGFHIARPMPFEDLRVWLNARTEEAPAKDRL